MMVVDSNLEGMATEGSCQSRIVEACLDSHSEEEDMEHPPLVVDESGRRRCCMSAFCSFELITIISYLMLVSTTACCLDLVYWILWLVSPGMLVITWVTIKTSWMDTSPTWENCTKSLQDLLVGPHATSMLHGLLYCMFLEDRSAPECSQTLAIETPISFLQDLLDSSDLLDGWHTVCREQEETNDAMHKPASRNGKMSFGWRTELCLKWFPTASMVPTLKVEIGLE